MTPEQQRHEAAMRVHALRRERALIESKARELERRLRQRRSFADTRRRLARFGIYATSTRPTPRAPLPEHVSAQVALARRLYERQDAQARARGVLIRPAIGQVLAVR